MPILLASLAVVGGTEYAAEIYGIVFVVVLFSVVVQGTLVPTVAARLGVPMRPDRPWCRPGWPGTGVSHRHERGGGAIRALALS